MQEETSRYGAADNNKRWKCGIKISAAEENCDAAYDQPGGKLSIFK